MRCDRRERERAHRRGCRDLRDRCRGSAGDGQPDPSDRAETGGQPGAAISGPADHGRVPRGRGRLPRHRQLRTEGRGQVRIQVAVGLPGPLQGGRDHGAARLGLRSWRHQRVHDVAQEAQAQDHSHARHSRLQRRRSRPALRHQLQPGNQHPRSDRARAALGRRGVRRNPGDGQEGGIRLRGRGTEEHVHDVPRGTREPRPVRAGAGARALLDDLRGPVHHPPDGAAERRHDLDRADPLSGAGHHPAAVPRRGAAQARNAGRNDQGQDQHRLHCDRGSAGRLGREDVLHQEHLRPRIRL